MLDNTSVIHYYNVKTVFFTRTAIDEKSTKIDFQEDTGMEISTSLNHFGSTKVAREWRLSKGAQIERLYYIKGGGGQYRVQGGEMRPFERGKIYIHPFNLCDSFTSDPSDPIDHIFFDFFTSPPIIADLPIIYDPCENPLLMEYIELLEAEIRTLEENASASEKREKKTVIELLFRALLCKLDNIRALPLANDDAVCRALDYISQNYNKPISINEIASSQGFDVSYFIRRFKRVMSTTPHVYLRTYRLMRAEELIKGGASVESAALAVGYENASSLRRALRSLK